MFIPMSIDMDWVAEQHAKGRNFTDIASELGTSVQMLRRRYRGSGGKIRATGGTPKHRSISELSEPDFERVIERNQSGESISSIATDLEVSNQMLGRKLRERGYIPIRQAPPQKIAGTKVDKVLRVRGLGHNYVLDRYNEDRMSVKEIASDLGLDQMTVSRWLKLQGVEVRHSNLSNQADRLFDAEWLVAEYSSGRTAQHIANELGVNLQTVLNYLRIADQEIRGPGQGESTGERELREFLLLHGVEYIANDRQIIAPYEVDIYIPECNVAIEFNGVYWHSEKFKDKNYHYDKYIAANNAGIKLIQIWEDQWNLRKDAVKKTILHKLGFSKKKIYARDTKIYRVSHAEASRFLDQNHIQGSRTDGIRLGLRHDGELVALMTFIRRSHSVYELTRFATSCSVVGGFSKLLKQFDREFGAEIISFADLCVSDGDLYIHNGFIRERFQPPDYSYLVGDRRVHKSSYRKEKFRDSEALLYDENLTERELAQLNNLLRVWDAGKIRFRRYT